MSDVGVAVIGCGHFGAELARALAAVPGASVRTVMDADATLAERLARELGCAQSGDLAAAVTDPGVRAVVVATPNFAHVEPALAAAGAGKHVFVEKPLAVRLTDCQRIIDATRAAGVTLQVGHLMRLVPGVRWLRDEIHAGAIGRVLHARVFRTRWMDLADNSSWKTDDRLSGSELLHELHDLDLLCWCVGRVEAVAAQTGNTAHPGAPRHRDAMQALLRFANGALGMLEQGSAYRTPEWRIVIGGADGTAVLDYATASAAVKRRDGRERRSFYDDDDANRSLIARVEALTEAGAVYGTARRRPDTWIQALIPEEMRRFAEVVRGTAAAFVTPEEAQHVVAVGLAALRASQIGAWVDVGSVDAPPDGLGGRDRVASLA